MACVTWCQYAGDIPDKADPNSKLFEWSITLSTFSNWFSNEVLGIFEGETPTIPTTLYAGVCSDASSASSAGTELSGGGYARVPVTFERVSDIKRWNPSIVVFPAATAEWTAGSFTLWDDANPGQGNYYAYGNLAGSVTVAISEAIRFPAETGIIIGMGSTVT